MVCLVVEKEGFKPSDTVSSLIDIVYIVLHNLYDIYNIYIYVHERAVSMYISMCTCCIFTYTYIKYMYIYIYMSAYIYVHIIHVCCSDVCSLLLIHLNLPPFACEQSIAAVGATCLGSKCVTKLQKGRKAPFFREEYILGGNRIWVTWT